MDLLLHLGMPVTLSCMEEESEAVVALKGRSALTNWEEAFLWPMLLVTNKNCSSFFPLLVTLIILLTKEDKS